MSTQVSPAFSSGKSAFLRPLNWPVAGEKKGPEAVHNTYTQKSFILHQSQQSFWVLLFIQNSLAAAANWLKFGLLLLVVDESRKVV